MATRKIGSFEGIEFFFLPSNNAEKSVCGWKCRFSFGIVVRVCVLPKLLKNINEENRVYFGGCVAASTCVLRFFSPSFLSLSVFFLICALARISARWKFFSFIFFFVEKKKKSRKSFLVSQRSYQSFSKRCCCCIRNEFRFVWVRFSMMHRDYLLLMVVYLKCVLCVW